MSMTPAEPAIFRGVIALELRDGMPPTQAALTVAGAGDLVAMLGRGRLPWVLLGLLLGVGGTLLGVLPG